MTLEEKLGQLNQLSAAENIRSNFATSTPSIARASTLSPGRLKLSCGVFCTTNIT